MQRFDVVKRNESSPAMAQQICLCLPSWCQGFESQVRYSIYSQILYDICHWNEKKTKIDKKKPGLEHI